MGKTLSLGMLAILLFSCKKESTPDNNSKNAPRIWVHLYSSRISENINDTALNHIEIVRASAEEVFGSYNNLDLGVVKYGDSVITKDQRNFYSLPYQNPNISHGWSNFLDGGVVWSVSGNTGLNIPSFTTTTLSTYPSIINKRFSLPITINRNSPYTVDWDNSVPADSVALVLSAGNIRVETGFMAGNISSYTFTPTQLQGLQPTSNAMIQIIGFIHKKTAVGDVLFNVRNIANSNVRYLTIQ